MSFSVGVVRDIARFADQAEEWDELAARFGQALLGHDWFLSCAEAFAADGDLHIVTVRHDGRLVAAAPLVLVRHGLVRRLEVLGASVLCEPTGFLYDSDESLRVLCTALAQLSVPIWLQRFAADEPIVAALSATSHGRGWLTQGSGGECPFLTCPDTWEEYLQSRSSQRRYDLRRARRRLESAGAIEFQYCRPEAEDLDGLLEAAFTVEASGWKGRTGSAILSRPAMRDFFARYTRRASRADRLQLCFLRLDGRPVAMQIVVVDGQRQWVLKVGYDEQWAQGSPGLQLLTESIREAMQQGARTYEFLGTAEPWIRPWASGTRSYLTLRYYPRSLRGVLAWGSDQASRFGGRLKGLVGSVRGHHGERKPAD